MFLFRQTIASRLGALTLAAALAAAPAQADDAPILRVFLTDGTIVACYGEYARVENRVVLSVPLGDDGSGRPKLQLVTMPADRVDWTRTERYRDAVRSAHYAATRGEQDFTAMTAEVAATLNAIATAPDPARQLELAERARRRLAGWEHEHFGYRASEVREIAALLDESISELRAAAGHQDFDLNFVAMAAPPPPEPLLGPPTDADLIAQALALAERAEDAAERQSLYEGAIAVIDSSAGRVSAPALAAARRHAERQLERERTIDREYFSLSRYISALARERARRADVRGVQAAQALLNRRDERLGGRRPQVVAAVAASVRDELEAARSLRLARDQYESRIGAYRSYERMVRRPVATLTLANEPLEDIRRLAGPDPQTLRSLAGRVARAARRLDGIVPPTGLSPVHDLLQSACRMAATAVSVREEAVALGSLDRAWSASAAAAGAQLLLARAQEELNQALTPPRLQ